MEQIGIKGVLEGIRDMLHQKDSQPQEDIGIIMTRMECARSMLDGVIKELTPPEKLPGQGQPGITKEGAAAKEDLK